MKHKLNAKQVAAEKKPGLLNDGGGLYLKTNKTGSKSWVFRWRDRTTKKLRAMGLGGFPDVGLAEARDGATEARKMVESGDNPILERDKALKAVQAESHAEEQAIANIMTFDRAAERFIAEKLAPECKDSKTAKTVPQWESSLKNYVSPHIGKMDVAEIGTDEVLAVLQPIWTKKPETASRVRMRLERVLAWAGTMGYRDRDRINPAMWKGHLSEILPAKSKVAPVKHFSALPYKELPKLYAELKAKDSLSALALRWTMLNTCRTGETIGATWSEIDDGIWCIPPERMKAGKLHRIPLTKESAAILEQLDKEKDYLFPGGNHGRQKFGHMSNNAMLVLLKTMRPGVTTHGLRSGFRDWAAEKTHHENFVVEMQLAHVVGGVEGAYRRGDLLEKRADMMTDWANYLAGNKTVKN